MAPHKIRILGREEDDGLFGPEDRCREEDTWKRPSSSLPGRQPLGRDAGLRARDAYDREREEESARWQERTVRVSREDNSRRENVRVRVYDEFDRYQAYEQAGNRPVYKREVKHKGLWITLIVLCLMMLTAMVLFVLPQLTGVRYRFLPNLAFANGSVISLDNQRFDQYQRDRAEMYTGRIYPGVYIDGVSVGGMTREEAIATLDGGQEVAQEQFSLSVTIGNKIWYITNETVKMFRNTEEVASMALTVGRENSAETLNTSLTPFQERRNRIRELKSEPVNFTTVVSYDRQALKAQAEAIAAFVNRDPVNSTVTSFDFTTHTFTFSEDQPGARVDAEELYGKLAALLDQADYFGAVTIIPEKVLADVTRTELMNSFRKISTYTTKTTSNKNRNTNINLSAQAISGSTVMPGDIFSFNGATGERTVAKGYKEAAAISGGQSKDEVGGGVCQTSSTLFNAVARADLEILERNPHAWPSSYVEKGLDATVNWPGLDFKFRNNKDYPIFIIAEYHDQHVTVDLYGMSLGADLTIELESETTEVIPQPSGTNYVLNTSLKPGESKKTVTGRKGYKVDTYKVWYQAGKEIKRELLFHSTYKAYQETVEYNPR